MQHDDYIAWTGSKTQLHVHTTCQDKAYTLYYKMIHSAWTGAKTQMQVHNMCQDQLQSIEWQQAPVCMQEDNSACTGRSGHPILPELEHASGYKQFEAYGLILPPITGCSRLPACAQGGSSSHTGQFSCTIIHF